MAAPALEPDPQKRALLVLKWILFSLRRHYYVGGEGNKGIKKPLNAFLGELFVGQWSDDKATTRIVTEQVRYVKTECYPRKRGQLKSGTVADWSRSHHPPITACYLWDEEHGIRVKANLTATPYNSNHHA